MVLQAQGSDIIPGRVVSEDDDFMMLEIAKHDNTTFTLRSGDRFYTMMFVRQSAHDGTLEAFKPWEPK